MNTQPSDTSTKQGPAKIIVAGVVAVTLVAAGAYVGFKKSAPQAQQIGTAVKEVPQVFNEFLVVTGKKADETVTATLTMPDGKEILIPERLTLDTTRAVFSYEGQGHDYTLTTELRNANDNVRSLAMKLSNDPMMIVITVGGFTPDDGLDLFVGPNSISSRTPLDWSGKLEQVIPLPLEPEGPFCLVMTNSSKIETVRVCHELPYREKKGLLG